MQLVTTRAEATQFSLSEQSLGKKVGFVPTMGALHQGHLSLVHQSIRQNDSTIVSIFVNPIQFNNADDLKKYPRTLDNDLELLESEGCNMVFAPSVEEMYPQVPTESYSFGLLEQVMEGFYRPGHFNGVAIVVRRLFDILRPHRAYFGEKDYQQLVIIRKMVEQFQLPVETIGCPIVREPDGLAMSSRNRRLAASERAQASFIYQNLVFAQGNAGKLTVKDLKNEIIRRFQNHPSFRLEYFEFSDSSSLLSFYDWNDAANIRAFIAVYLGEVRLIDNIVLKETRV